MTKKELQEYSVLKAEILQLKEQICELEQSKLSPGIPKLNGMPHSSANSNTLDTYVIQHDRLLSLYVKKCRELEDKQIRIECVIESLNGNERVLMRHRYIDGLRWEDICSVMCYSWRQIHRIHAKILREIANNQDK